MTSWQNTWTNPTATAAYAYDGAGQRVAQSVTANGTTTTTWYIGGGLEELTVSGASSTLTKYESVPGVCNVVIVGTGPSESLSYVTSDGLGSVSEALDGSGHVTAQQLYGPYGGVRYSSGAMPTAKGFTGQYADAASSGLDYYGARYYDPLIGQFTSADTDAKGGLNRYAYVADDPETATDPSGHRYCTSDGSSCSSKVGGGSGGSGGHSSSPTGATAKTSTSGGSGGSYAPPYPGSDGSQCDTAYNACGNATACQGKAHCVLLFTGPTPPNKGGDGFEADLGTWAAWMKALLRQFDGDVGFILFEAVDAITGALLLHGLLSSLAGYTGQISAVGHSNGAAALFTYFALANEGLFAGDAPISSFVALDAPASWNPLVRGAEHGWSLWDPWATTISASQYVSAHGIRGIYAWDAFDDLSGPVFGSWATYETGNMGGSWWDPSTYFWANHLYLVNNPDEDNGLLLNEIS